MRKIVIVGTPGSGKTTLAKAMAKVLGLHHIELDAICHQANWQPLGDKLFRAALIAQMDAHPEGWVICGNYNRKSGDVHVERADTVVWLDLPRALVMRRVFIRTLTRVLSRQRLWNGNRERLTNLWAWDPNENIIRWAWTMWPEYRHRYEERIGDGRWSHLEVVRLTSVAQVAAFTRVATPPISAAADRAQATSA